jgi:glycosyltransferase involved in cell wall biosynthesis
MDVWFDYDLVNFAARRLSRVSFVLIGPDDLARRRLERRPNMHLLGRRPYDALPGYLHNADVGLIPFDTANHARLINSVHPLKLYEYMACGLPVVASEWEELVSVRSPALLAKNPNGFVEAIEHALAEPADRQRYVQFATAADWKTRIVTLLEAQGF